MVVDGVGVPADNVAAGTLIPSDAGHSIRVPVAQAPPTETAEVTVAQSRGAVPEIWDGRLSQISTLSAGLRPELDTTMA